MADGNRTRFTWGIEMTCKLILHGLYVGIDAEHFYRLHALPSPTRSYEEPHVLGMDRRAAVRPHYAADSRGYCG